MLARVAIVDPELTYDLPSKRLTASTGLDALTQLIGAVYLCTAGQSDDGRAVHCRYWARGLFIGHSGG